MAARDVLVWPPSSVTEVEDRRGLGERPHRAEPAGRAAAALLVPDTTRAAVRHAGVRTVRVLRPTGAGGGWCGET